MRAATRAGTLALGLTMALTLVAAAGCGYQGERGERTERTEGRRTDEETSEGLRASAVDGVAMGVSTGDARFVRNLIGFQGPESVKYDPDLDAYFVTNMTGAGSIKDGNGYIVRLSASDPDSGVVLVQGGRNGAVLDSPKGTALHGDTLWVADISVLRGFDRRTGGVLANIDFAPLGAVQLNDVAVGPDGIIRVTDTGIIMSPKGVIHIGPDRIFTVGPNRAIGVMAHEPAVTWPNGITWDSPGERWIVVNFDPFRGRVYSLSPDGKTVQTLREGSGRLDGVELLPGTGGILFTSWADSSIHLLKGGTDRKLIREVPEAADIGYDSKRGLVLVPLSVLGWVELWRLR
jgi:hypothetical protein